MGFRRESQSYEQRRGRCPGTVLMSPLRDLGVTIREGTGCRPGSSGAPGS